MDALTVHEGRASVRPGSRHLSTWQRLLVHGSGCLLLLSGLAWLGLHYLMGAGAGELPHPLEAWAMRLHALTAWLATFVFGHLAASHMPRGWHTTWRQRLRTQRRLGVALCALAAVLVLSGYALMYLVPEPVRPSVGWAHVVAGLAMGLVLAVHGRRAGPRSRA